MKTDTCKQIREWLAHCQVQESSYDQGGIFDPLDQRVIGDHYATTHFAWACALTHSAGPDAQWLESARNAILFHIRTSPEEYPPGSWDYHWDFNNLAFVETYGLLADHLNPEERQVWQQALLQWETNAHGAMNWVAMRALALFRRGTLLDRSEDIRDAEELLDRVLTAQTRDGCFDDLPGISRPGQYHAYTACLVLRMKEIDPVRITKACVRAVRWLLAVCAPDGDITGPGRGQGQIFGVACAIYLFRAARTLDPERASHYQWAEEKNLARLTARLDSRGFLPLVLNDRPVEERCGWYDYHHLTVYNAFTLVWLLLARTKIHTDSASEQPHQASLANALPPPSGTTFLPQSEIMSMRSSSFSLVCAAGAPGAGYAADVGISPHFVFFKEQPLFRYPVGPGPGKYGSGTHEKRQAENIWAPLIHVKGQWMAPFGGRSTIEPLAGNGCRMTYCRDGIIWERNVIVTSWFLEVRDVLNLSASSLRVDAVRTVNIALKQGLVTDRTPSRLIMEGPGLVLSAWSDNTDLIHRGTVHAADGIVDIFAMETLYKNQRLFKSGFRLRPLPTGSGHGVPDIVCMTWDPWSDLWKRKQRLLHDMAKNPDGPNVIYAEPPLSLTTIVEDPAALTQDSLKGRQYRRALSGNPMTMGGNFSLYTPLLLLPGARSLPKIHSINQYVAGRRFKRVVQKAGFSNYILWLYHPSQLWILEHLGDRADLIVYDWTDDWVAAFPDHLPREQKTALEKDQLTLLKRCDLVFGVSSELCRRARKHCPTVFHLPNATDPEVFRPAPVDAVLHPVFKGMGFPCLTYLSQITERLDVKLLVDLARRRPEWQFLLIGPVICPLALLAPLRSLKNIHFTGSLPYTEAARVLAQSQVSILPHKVDALTRTLDPIKLYDYLAVGNPVVSTPVAMHPDLKHCIRIAATCDAFEKAVQVALEEPAQASLVRRKAALEHVWDRRAEQALKILRQFF